MRKIEARPIKNQSIAVPGSKSYTHRIFIAAALADGPPVDEKTGHSAQHQADGGSHNREQSDLLGMGPW